MQSRAEPKDREEVLKRLDFPASLSEIMKRARDIGGIDREVHEINRPPSERLVQLL